MWRSGWRSPVSRPARPGGQRDDYAYLDDPPRPPVGVRAMPAACCSWPISSTTAGCRRIASRLAALPPRLADLVSGESLHLRLGVTLAAHRFVWLPFT